MPRLLLAFTFFLFATVGFGQIGQIETYKKLYTTADSLNKAGKPFTVDSLTFEKVKSLNKQHPSKYFEEATHLFNDAKYNDAAFVYYLGILRYRYYNSVNPKYQASDDGALAASLQYVVGEMVNLFLKTNFDNFVSAIKFSCDYYLQHDYTFYSKTKNPTKYDEIAKGFSTLIEDLKTNKTKYEKEWNEEKIEMITNIDKAIDEYNKTTPEEKKRLKNN